MILTFFLFLLSLLMVLILGLYLHKKGMLPSFFGHKEFLFTVQTICLAHFGWLMIYYQVINELCSAIFLGISPVFISLNVDYINNNFPSGGHWNKLKNVLFSSSENATSSTPTGNANASNSHTRSRSSSPSSEQVTRSRSSSPEGPTRSRSSSPERVARPSFLNPERLRGTNSPILTQIGESRSSSPERAIRPSLPVPERRGRPRITLPPILGFTGNNSPIYERVNSDQFEWTSSSGSEISLNDRTQPRVWGQSNPDATFDQHVTTTRTNTAPTITNATNARTNNPIFNGVGDIGVVEFRDKQLVGSIVFAAAFSENSIYHLDRIADPTFVQQYWLNGELSVSLQPFANNLADFLENFSIGRHLETRFGYPSVFPITSLWLVHYHANNFPQVFLSPEWLEMRNSERILPGAMTNVSEQQRIRDWGRPVVLFDNNIRRQIVQALRNEP